MALPGSSGMTTSITRKASTRMPSACQNGWST
jgi:hypothetical protein